jgi:hypothetical protein
MLLDHDRPHTYSFSPLSPALPLIRDGRLIALAVSTARRTPVLPDVPTLAEAALPGYEFQGAVWGLRASSSGLDATRPAHETRRSGRGGNRRLILPASVLRCTAPQHKSRFLCDSETCCTEL